jgi:hypothetical protein
MLPSSTIDRAWEYLMQYVRTPTLTASTPIGRYAANPSDWLTRLRSLVQRSASFFVFRRPQ